MRYRSLSIYTAVDPAGIQSMRKPLLSKVGVGGSHSVRKERSIILVGQAVI